jgi:hypothetical protein
MIGELHTVTSVAPAERLSAAACLGGYRESTGSNSIGSTDVLEVSWFSSALQANHWLFERLYLVDKQNCCPIPYHMSILQGRFALSKSLQLLGKIFPCLMESGYQNLVQKKPAMLPHSGLFQSTP